MRAFALVLWLPCALSVAGLLAPSAAYAQASPDAVTRKKVQTYLDLAAELFKANDFEGALTELRRAEALSPLAVVEFNIARCLEELHRDGDAYAAYDRYVALNDATAGASDCQKRAADAMARLMVSLTGGLEITCPVEGSSVLVLGLMQIPEQCPWKAARVRAGTYEVQTFSPGFPTLVSHVVVQGGRTATLFAQPVPKSSPATTPASDVPRATEPAPQPQPRPDQPPTGSAAAPAPVVGVQTSATYQSSYSSAKIIGGVVLTGASLVAFGVMGILLWDRDQHFSKIKAGQLATEADITGEAKAADNDRLYAGVSGAAGGALLIPAIILFATCGETTEVHPGPTALTITPTAFPSGGGVVLSGVLP